MFHTTGEQADIKQGMVAEFRRVVAEHGIWASNSHPFFLEPADQPEQLTVTVKGVTTHVTGEQEDRKEVTGSVMVKHDKPCRDATVNKTAQQVMAL